MSLALNNWAQDVRSCLSCNYSRESTKFIQSPKSFLVVSCFVFFLNPLLLIMHVSLRTGFFVVFFCIGNDGIGIGLRDVTSSSRLTTFFQSEK